MKAGHLGEGTSFSGLRGILLEYILSEAQQDSCSALGYRND